MTDMQADRAAHHRARDLEWIETNFIGGKQVAHALRTGTIEEREKALNGLKLAALACSRASHARRWSYNHPRHMHLCRIIERERSLLAAEELQAARCKHQATVRQVSRHLHRRGWAPLSLLLRLSTARGGFLAAIAGRKEEGEAR